MSRTTKICGASLAMIAALALWLTAGAQAHTGAGATQSKAINAAVVAYRTAQGSSSCMSGDKLRLTGDEVSTANARYAYAKTADNSCTFSFGYFVRRSSPTSSDWKVIANVQDSTQLCSYYAKRLPAEIIAEFALVGLEKNKLNTCVFGLTATGPSTVGLGQKVTFTAGGFLVRERLYVSALLTNSMSGGANVPQHFTTSAAGVGVTTFTFPRRYTPCLTTCGTVPFKPGQAVTIFICPASGPCAVRNVRIK